jgi:hypothetical protein
MPGTRCVNCRWWNGDTRYAAVTRTERDRHGMCQRIIASPALAHDTPARLLPVAASPWLDTRFDFSCALWETSPVALSGEKE